MITIDIETKSDKDISKCGVYAYTDTPYFDILLFAYSIDGQSVQVVDTANGEEIPENVLAALADKNVVKRAFNCNFERVCLSKYLLENHPQYFQSYSIDEDTVGDFLNPESWHCSMIHARTLGLPSSLAEVGKVLGIEQQKMTEGKALIKFFCVPYDIIDGVPQFHSPTDYPDKWEIFKAYNKRDVEAELEIDRKLSRFPVPDFIWQEFYLDQEINDRGILVDMQLADKAISLDAEAKEELTAEMKRLTGVDYTFLLAMKRFIFGRSVMVLSSATTIMWNMVKGKSVSVALRLARYAFMLVRSMRSEIYASLSQRLG